MERYGPHSGTSDIVERYLYYPPKNDKEWKDQFFELMQYASENHSDPKMAAIALLDSFYKRLAKDLAVGYHPADRALITQNFFNELVAALQDPEIGDAYKLEHAAFVEKAKPILQTAAAAAEKARRRESIKEKVSDFITKFLENPDLIAGIKEEVGIVIWAKRHQENPEDMPEHSGLLALLDGLSPEEKSTVAKTIAESNFATTYKNAIEQVERGKATKDPRTPG